MFWWIIFGSFIGAITLFLFLLPKLKVYEKINKEIIIMNENAQKEKEKINEEIISEKEKIKNLLERKEELTNEINQIKEYLIKIEESVELTKKKTLNVMQEELSISAEKEREKYLKAEQEYKNHYLKVLDEYSKKFLNDIDDKILLKEKLEKEIEDLKSKSFAAIEAHKRNLEKEENKNFFRLQLSNEDLKEIKELKNVASSLRNSEPLYKVIWKVYYENPYTDLIGRVIGKETVMGIYKIQNLHNGMCYVGQCVDAANRWKQHIKRGIGAETPTKNKLYPAMMKYGVENFSFEIIEKCSKEKLNEREQYWQEYFKAKEFGYSIK